MYSSLYPDCTAVVMLLLGIVGMESKYIFHERSEMASKEIQIVWISCFELVGLLTSGTPGSI